MKTGGEAAGTRVLVLWSELPGYAAACVRALVAKKGVDVVVVRYSHASEKPFSAPARRLPCPVHVIGDRTGNGKQWRRLQGILTQHRPDAALVSGWSIECFNRAARWVKRRGGVTVCMADNQWRGGVRQWAGALYARVAFGRRYSAMFVPGERARPLATACGFSGRRLLMGGYSADWEMFAGAFAERRKRTSDWPHAFLFVGRLTERKGIPDLLEAYRLYRGRVRAPWELQVAGDGPLRQALARREGVLPLGFRQPAELPGLMAKVGAFVLPSREEPWGVVVHEAAAAGLPVICTHQCGSGAELVRNLYNGLLFEAGDVEHLAALMAALTQKTDADLAEMGMRSHEMSRQFTPELWADRLLQGIRLLRRSPR